MRKNDQKGVTLVELSIAILIIGILLAGTLGGMNLAKSAKLRKVATELTFYHKAIKQFEEEYSYLPGDFPKATAFWSTATNDGNGNTLIDWDAAITPKQEDLFVWEHLTLSDIIPGTYTGNMQTGTTVRYGLNTNAPNSQAYTNVIFAFYNETTALYNTLGHQILMSALDSDGRPLPGFLAAKDAYSIDKKMDDGKANYGRLYTSAASGCIASSDYDLDDTANKTCRLVYWYRKF
jgi:prepilin-type N-terminal cleavage/methylation domain-containing protein